MKDEPKAGAVGSSARGRRVKLVVVALLFLPGVAFALVGAILAIRGRTAIDGAERAAGSVTRAYTETKRDLDGKVERDFVDVTFETRSGATASVRAQVFTTAFLHAGDRVDVLYDPKNPSEARVCAGFFAEPYGVVFWTLFGVLWLAIAGGLVALAWPR